MDRAKIDNALQNERKKYLEYEDTHDVLGLETLYLRIAKEIPEDLDSQPLVIAMEECGELSQAIAKGIRGKADVIHLTEEIADVSIIIDYVVNTWNIPGEDIRIIRALKLEQLEGIVKRLQTEYKSKLSALSMMDTFTTLRDMTYDGFFKEYMLYADDPIVVPITVNTKSQVAQAFVDMHWRMTPQIMEDGLKVLQGAIKAMKIHSRNLLTYVTNIYDESVPTDSSEYTKALWATYQVDLLIWVIAMTFRRFSVLTAWVGDCEHTTVSFDIPYAYGEYLNSHVHTLGTRIAEFIDYAEYNSLTVTTASNIRKALNDILDAVIVFENKMFSKAERITGEATTWLQFGNLLKMMKGDDSGAGGSI